MKACILEQPMKVSLQQMEIPQISGDEILLQVTCSGICTNDVRDYKGSGYTYPRIGGHEYAGRIVKIGENVDPEQYPLGAKAVQYIIDECGGCPSCKHGKENLCDHAASGKTFYNPDGLSGYFGFSEYVAVQPRHVYLYPEETPDEVIAFTEPLACVINSINKTHIEMGNDVVVIGGGVMGLLHVLCAKKQGARVIVSETAKERRELALELGADLVINPLEEDPVKTVFDLTDGRGADVVYNTTAIPAVAAQAIQMAGKGGVVNMFSSIHPNEPVPIDCGRIHSQEIKVTGTVSPTIKSFAQAVDCLAKNILNIQPLIDRIYQPEQIQEALEYAARPDTYKTMIRFS